MLRNFNRRLSAVEEVIPLPFTPARFSARARQRMKRTGESYEVAITSLMRTLSVGELEWIIAEAGGATLAMESAGEIECYQEIVHDCTCSD